MEQARLAAPGPDQVLVRMAASGLCHTDLEVVTGAVPQPLPAVLGHEGAGIVDAVGEGRLKLDELITRRITLDGINEGMQALRDRSAIRTVITLDP